MTLRDLVQGSKWEEICTIFKISFLKVYFSNQSLLQDQRYASGSTGKEVADRGVWDCSIAELHWFMLRLVYAAVESRLIFQEQYLKSTFIKAANSIYSFCRQGNSYGVVTCLSLDSYSMLPISFAISIFSNTLGEISCLVSSF